MVCIPGYNRRFCGERCQVEQWNNDCLTRSAQRPYCDLQRSPLAGFARETQNIKG
jgi:hypothetical protein